MKKFILLPILTLGFGFATAHAEGGGHHEGSEFFYQAGAGAQDVTAKLAYVMGEIETTTATNDVDGYRVGAEYEYGLSDMYSVGAQLMYSAITTEGTTSDTESKGVNDLEVFFKGHAMEGALRFGAVLEYALEDAETKANGDSNASSGGAMLQPYIGYQLAVATGYAGVKVFRDFEIMAEEGVDKSSSPTAKTETEGGETTGLTLFYEHNLDSAMKVGGKLTISEDEDDTEKNKGTGAKTKTKGTSSTKYAVYGVVPMGSGELLPEFSYEDLEYSSADGTLMSFNVGYRLAF